jgi:hypothetical protein
MQKKLNNPLSTFALLLAFCFALNFILLSAHHSSHEISEFLEGTLEESSLESDNHHKLTSGSHNLVDHSKSSPAKFANKQSISSQSKISSLVILIKNKLENFGHKFRSHQHSKSSDCDLCLLSLLQSQALSITLLALLISLFYLTMIFFSYYKTEKSIILPSQARAPPFNNLLLLDQ